MSAFLKREDKKDFETILVSSALISENLKADDNFPDISEQFNDSPGVDGNQLYYLEPYQSILSPMIEHQAFASLSPAILEKYRRIECASFMGLFPEINRAWITIDNILYIWDYLNPSNFLQYDGLSEVIVSVVLAIPKPGIFTELVKYVLVVATPVEVVILAITWVDDLQQLKIQHTKYGVPSDDVTMIKMCSSITGRVFMIGNDGHLYELVYDNEINSWSTYLGLGDAYKCKKLKHNAWSVVSLLPTIVKTVTGLEDSYADMAVDNIRNILYTLSAKGWLGVYYLGQNGNEFVPAGGGACNVYTAAYEFLYGKNGRYYPDASVFRDPSQYNLCVLSIQPISLVESRSVHLVVIFSNGIRMFLSVLSDDSTPFLPNLYGRLPHRLQVLHIRSPPSSAVVTHLVPASNTGGGSTSTNTNHGAGAAASLSEGQLPSFNPTAPLSCQCAFYSQGVFLLTVQASSTISSASTVQRRESLMGITEDLTSRKGITTSMPSTVVPSLREGVCVVSNPRNPSGAIDGVVHDIQESVPFLHDHMLCQMKSLYLASKSPLDGQLAYRNSIASAAVRASTVTAEHVPYSTSSLPFAGYPDKIGLRPSDVDTMVPLGELSLQHMPVSRSTKRQFVILTNTGVHFLTKVRPVDYLIQILMEQTLDSSDLYQNIQTFAGMYGALTTCTMCAGLACNLPCDADTGGKLLSSNEYSTSPAQELIARRAITALQQLGGVPMYRNTGNVVANANMASDLRTVFSTDFHFSMTHQAIYSLASRILRPIWHRSMVTVGQPGQPESVLLTRQGINCIKGPILCLHAILTNYFGVSLSARDVMANSSAVDANFSGKSSVVIRQLHFMAHNVEQQTVSLEIDAKKRELQSLTNLCITLHRCVQALSLFDILTYVSKQYNVKIQWSPISNISFYSFVSDSAVHDTTKSFITNILRDNNNALNMSQKDELSELLTKSCYLFYTVGDKYLYEGFKLLALCESYTANCNEKYSILRQASKNFVTASKYFTCVRDVDGEESILSVICSRLLSLGGDTVEYVADICLTASSNFGGNVQLRVMHSDGYQEGAGVRAPSLSSEDKLKGLQCCYRCLLDKIKMVCVTTDRIGNGALTVPTSAQVNTDVLAKFISHSLAICDDVMFHNELYVFLLEMDAEQLVQISTRHIENFLRQHDAGILYRHYTWHGKHTEAAYLMELLAHEEEEMPLEQRIQFLVKAVNSATMACQSSSIGSHSAGSRVDDGVKYSFDKLEDLKNKLEVAVLQDSILKKLSNDFKDIHKSVGGLDSSSSAVSSSTVVVVSGDAKKQLDNLNSVLTRISSQLVDVSYLYNSVTEPYKLWEYSLLVLFICKHDDSALVSRLWRSIIFRMVPTVARDMDIQEYLNDKRKSPDLMVNKRRQFASSSFEDVSEWLPSLIDEVLQLGAKLYSDLAGNVTRAEGPTISGNFGVLMFLPVPTLLEELEEISSMLFSSASALSGVADSDNLSGWVRRIFLSIGVSHVELMEYYFDVFRKWQGKKASKMLHILASTSRIAFEWTKLALSNSASQLTEVRAFTICAKSGKMRSWLEKLSQHLNTLSGHNLSPADGKILQHARKDIAETENMLMSLLLS